MDEALRFSQSHGVRAGEHPDPDVPVVEVEGRYRVEVLYFILPEVRFDEPQH